MSNCANLLSNCIWNICVLYSPMLCLVHAPNLSINLFGFVPKLLIFTLFAVKESHWQQIIFHHNNGTSLMMWSLYCALHHHLWSQLQNSGEYNCLSELLDELMLFPYWHFDIFWVILCMSNCLLWKQCLEQHALWTIVVPTSSLKCSTIF